MNALAKYNKMFPDFERFFQHITVKKIPKQVLSRCEWEHDDYSLQVENLTKAPPEPGQQDMFDEE